jgi:two-component system sensor histidine kinase KdpD
VASNLAEHARRDAEAAKQRRREVELLYDLSQRLLASENEFELLNALPLYVQETFSIRSVSMMAADHPSVYRSSPDAEVDESLLRLTLSRGEPTVQAGTAYVPLRLGVRTVGALAVTGYDLSRETLDAIESLAGLSIERVRALEALSKNQAMQENERLRSALLDSVTHEFRTPLTAIKANVTTLLSGAAPDVHGTRELLTVIDKETDQLNRLVGEAAEMGQLDAGMFKLDLHLHSIQEALQPALEDAKASIENHPVEIRAPSDLPTVRMDTQRIREVLIHLLDNAGKYSGPGTPIKVTAEVKSGRLVISVADRGIGIDSRTNIDLRQVLPGGRQRYTAPGAGMGLPIAKAIQPASDSNRKRHPPFCHPDRSGGICSSFNQHLMQTEAPPSPLSSRPKWRDLQFLSPASDANRSATLPLEGDTALEMDLTTPTSSSVFFAQAVVSRLYINHRSLHLDC